LKTENAHIIEKVLVEVNTRKVETANSIKNIISLFLNDEVFPKIEMALEANNTNNLIRIDKLQIQLSLPEQTDFSNPDATVLAKIEEQIRQQVFAEIQEISAGAPEKEEPQFQHVTQKENQEQIFLFYLENGYYPWYGNNSHLIEFTESKQWVTSFSNAVFIEKLKTIVKKQGVFQRFVFQFPFEMVYRFLSHINSRISGNSVFIHKIVKTFQPLLKANLLNSLFFVSVESESRNVVFVIEKLLQQIINETEKVQHGFIRMILKTTPESIFGTPEFHNMVNNLPAVQKRQVLQNLPVETKLSIQKRNFKILTETNGFDLLPNSQDKTNDFFDKELTEIRVQNAGLILLHPFFRHFFTVLKLLGKQNEILEDKKFEAVQILHFLATGEEEFWEGDLIFEKFICGIPLQNSLPKQTLISLEMKKEAETLLKETIKNWPALKRTSPDGLRQMFLQRNGKLVQKSERYKLVMERKAQDVLLEKIDWNISIIQLPWRKELLTVDW
jgi:hypothetical protein